LPNLLISGADFEDFLLVSSDFQVKKM
jgi:hypothetical protein